MVREGLAGAEASAGSDCVLREGKARPEQAGFLLACPNLLSIAVTNTMNKNSLGAERFYFGLYVPVPAMLEQKLSEEQRQGLCRDTAHWLALCGSLNLLPI